jgi:transcriptional regulator GlxA family with amidase domain
VTLDRTQTAIAIGSPLIRATVRSLVAVEAGFGTTTSLRLHLHTTLGANPSSYRTTFRGEAHG